MSKYHWNHRAIELTRVPHPQIGDDHLPIAIRMVSISYVTRELGTWAHVVPEVKKIDVLPAAMRYDATMIYFIGGGAVLVKESYEEVIERMRRASEE